jgi:hypothetical protein
MGKDYAKMMPASMNPNEAMAGGGSPTAVMENVDMMREQVMAQLESVGVFNSVSNDAEMQEILALVEELVQAMISGDQNALAQNPLMQILGSAPQQQAPAAPGPAMGGGGMPGGGMPPMPGGM